MVRALRDFGVQPWFYLIPSRQLRDFDAAEHERMFGADKFHLVRRGGLESLAFNARLARMVATAKLSRCAPLLRQGRSGNVDHVFPRYAVTGIPDRATLNGFDAVIVEYVHFSKILEYIPDSVYKIIDTHDSFQNEFTDAAEAEGLARADRVLAIQTREANRFAAILSRSETACRRGTSVLTASHLLDLTDEVPIGKTRGATFFGSSFASNLLSLRYFMNQVLPRVLAEMPEFQLYLAGSICNDVADQPGVVKLGRVEAVADAFRDAPILINSIRSGTGIKIKLLEAMALGVPAVSTRRGVEGIADTYLNGSIIVDDEDAEAFAQAVVMLVRNDAVRIALGGKARYDAKQWNVEQRGALLSLIEDIKAHGRAGRWKGDLSMDRLAEKKKLTLRAKLCTASTWSSEW